ncbi:MAG: hypothetical protein M1816_003932 [Peltula sp. TS41687]|nr:MAG: hypothetical protein M1816_003932 [Peltula sp. TS41687]
MGLLKVNTNANPPTFAAQFQANCLKDATTEAVRDAGDSPLPSVPSEELEHCLQRQLSDLSRRLKAENERSRLRGEAELRKMGYEPGLPFYSLSSQARDVLAERYIEHHYGPSGLPAVDDPCWKWQLDHTGAYFPAPHKTGLDYFPEDCWAKFGKKQENDL